MLPCYKGQKSSSEGTQRDLKHQEQNHTPRKIIEGFKGRGGGTREI
jgi:hypothetical protein